MDNEVFLYCTLVSMIGGVIMLQMMSHNWFKKERFKFEVFNLKKQNDLQLKKMARDMGLSSTSSSHKLVQPAGDNVGGLLEIAKNLPPESLGAIADIIQGRLGGGEGEGQVIPEGIEGLLDFAMKNPDIVKGFTQGLTKGREGGDDGGFIGG